MRPCAAPFRFALTGFTPNRQAKKARSSRVAPFAWAPSAPAKRETENQPSRISHPFISILCAEGAGNKWLIPDG
jgi:hypothetical protein